MAGDDRHRMTGSEGSDTVRLGVSRTGVDTKKKKKKKKGKRHADQS
jgi:hypothetical protein